MSFKVKDHFYKKAKKENFLARSIYKLEEIDKKFHIIKKGQKALDLGYFPGSWAQYLIEQIGPQGKLAGIDIQEVNESLNQYPNVSLFQMSIEDIKECQTIVELAPFDVICSDMAPKTTGIKSVDQDRSLELVEMVLDLVDDFLVPGGSIVLKVFESQRAQDFLKLQKKNFEHIHFFRPKSTRSTSKEMFVIGKNWKKNEV